MPYFIFKISHANRLDYLDMAQDYQQARSKVRQLRAEHSTDEQVDYRLIFANQRAEAEALLSRPRDHRVIGED
jgi:hypothetical protein